MTKRTSQQKVSILPKLIKTARALQCFHRQASLTVEAAFIIPVFFLTMITAMGFFLLIFAEMQVNEGLQYTAQMLAVSYADSDDEKSLLSLAEGKALFCTYMYKQNYEGTMIKGGLAGISMAGSDFEGEYVTLCADYQVELPVMFWRNSGFAVSQQVCAKKWTGAEDGSDSTDGDWVYITPEGEAYHRNSNCPYLKLSIQTVIKSQLASLRSNDRSIYKPCSCYRAGSQIVFITNYGNEYHSSLTCSGLKRTLYRVREDAVGDRHACPKCGG